MRSSHTSKHVRIEIRYWFFVTCRSSACKFRCLFLRVNFIFTFFFLQIFLIYTIIFIFIFYGSITGHRDRGETLSLHTLCDEIIGFWPIISAYACAQNTFATISAGRRAKCRQTAFVIARLRNVDDDTTFPSVSVASGHHHRISVRCGPNWYLLQNRRY